MWAHGAQCKNSKVNKTYNRQQQQCTLLNTLNKLQNFTYNNS